MQRSAQKNPFHFPDSKNCAATPPRGVMIVGYFEQFFSGLIPIVVKLADLPTLRREAPSTPILKTPINNKSNKRFIMISTIEAMPARFGFESVLTETAKIL